MKTINKFMLVALAATSIISCQKEIPSNEEILPDASGTTETPAGETVTFSATVDNAQTKTMIYYEDGITEFATLFTSSDKISVNGVTSTNTKANEDRDYITFDVDGVTPPYYAVTATQVLSENGYDAENHTYKINVNGTGRPQEFRKVNENQYVSYHSTADILAAYATEEYIRFKHLTTFYAITVDTENSTVTDNIKTIYVRQGDGGHIAGQWSISFEGDSFTPVLTPTATTAYIAYSCGDEGVAQGTTMIIGIPSYNYEEGLIFTLKDVNGKFASYKVKKEKTQHAADGGLLIPFKPAFKPGPGSITTAEQWNEFAELMNNTEKEDWDVYRWIGDGTIKLGADIIADDLTPITVDFPYTFDGNGKTITRNNATAALFNSVSGEVKNLTLAGSLTLTDEGAPFVNTLAAGGRLTDCTNQMTVNFEAADHAYVGGLVKNMEGAVINGCVNKGEITVKVDASEANRNVAVGGIVSQILAAAEDNAQITNCMNTASVTITPKSAADASYGMPVCALGGVVGWLRSAKSFNFDNCDNSGSITLSADDLKSETGYKAYAMCVGGIIGTGAAIATSSGIIYAPDSDNATFDITLNGCDNSGVICNLGVNYSGETEATIKAGNKKVFTGGLAGSLLGTTEKYVSITSCSNTGDIYTYNLTGETSSAQSGYCSVVGGFVGFGGYLSMDKCTVNCNINNGVNAAVRPTVSTAGVIGFTLRPFTLSNSKIYYTAYFQRLNHFKMNRAVVAVVPAKYLGATGSEAKNMAMMPAIEGSTITNCEIGAKLLTSSSVTTSDVKTDLKSSLTTELFKLASDGTSKQLVNGQGYKAADHGSLAVDSKTAYVE